MPYVRVVSQYSEKAVIVVGYPVAGAGYGGCGVGYGAGASIGFILVIFVLLVIILAAGIFV